MLERPRVAVERPPETFEDFYTREYQAVVGLAYALSGSRWGAEDLAQEVYLRLARMRCLARIDDQRAFVFRAAKNLKLVDADDMGLR